VQQQFGLLNNAVFSDSDDDNNDDDTDNAAGGRRNLLVPLPASVFPSLLLLERDNVAPVARAVAGLSYTLALSHFDLAVAGVEIRLYEGVPPAVRPEATITLPKRAAATTTTASGDQEGLTVAFVAPEPLRGGAGRRSRAYLRASYAGLPMPFADTLAFDLVRSEAPPGR